MMQGQLNNELIDYYKEARSKARSFLEKLCRFDECDINDEDISHVSKLHKSAEIWRVTTPAKDSAITFIIAVPDTYPDRLPMFYLTKKDYSSFGCLPHVSRNRFVCTRDPSVVVINDSKPDEAMAILFNIAVDIVNKGRAKMLVTDFKEEFLAYWGDGEKLISVINCPTPLAQGSCLLKFDLSDKLYGASSIITTSQSDAKAWLSRLGIERSLRNETNVFFVKLPQIPETLPTTNQDVIAMLGGIDSATRRLVESYRGHTILALVGDEYEPMLIAWGHRLFSVKGFRTIAGVIPLGVLIRNYLGKEIVRISIKRLDRDRIIRRAMHMNMAARNDDTIMIVGCGAVGSNLAMMLARSGYQRFILVDPDKLTEENVARHLCGCQEAATSEYKVDAVRRHLERHFPYISATGYNKDIIELLRDNLSIFENVSHIIISTANMAAERRINDCLKEQLARSVIYLWIEPLGVAGHVLYISHENGGCYRCCFDSDGEYRYSVVEKGQQIQRRETGCQTTFTPYGAADLEIYCAIACKEIINIIKEPPRQSKLATWIGDRVQFETSGYKISDCYAAHESYCIQRREIQKRSTCESCK